MDARRETPEKPSDLAAVSDQDLLAQFRSAHSPAVFNRIVERHGPMVLRTAFRLVGNWHDAEDVTQAVFLVLAQRVGSVNSTLGGWLHKVTRDVSIQMLRARARRARREEDAVRQKALSPASEGHLREELDLVLVQLPDRLREAVVLRYLEGHGQEEAARMAGCDKGTLSRRCTQGLSRLGSLLSRRGVVVAPAMLAGFLTNQATAAVPATTLSALQTIGVGRAVASAQAALLAKGTLHAMFWAKLKLCAAVVATVAAVGVAAPLVVSSASPAKVDPAKTPRQVLFRLDFEDGKLPAICTGGKVVDSLARPGNRFCLEGDFSIGRGRVFLQNEPALFNYSEDLALVFDLWADAQVRTVDLHFWNRTQQASQGAGPLYVPSERWVEGIVVRIADFKAGPSGPKPGDAIVNLGITAGQVGGKLYVDNLEIVRAADLPSSPLQLKK
jgi:RNA polymerase sigma factor (sigma-70 family)